MFRVRLSRLQKNVLSFTLRHPSHCISALLYQKCCLSSSTYFSSSVTETALNNARASSSSSNVGSVENLPPTKDIVVSLETIESMLKSSIHQQDKLTSETLIIQTLQNHQQKGMKILEKVIQSLLEEHGEGILPASYILKIIHQYQSSKNHKKETIPEQQPQPQTLLVSNNICSHLLLHAIHYFQWSAAYTTISYMLEHQYEISERAIHFLTAGLMTSPRHQSQITESVADNMMYLVRLVTLLLKYHQDELVKSITYDKLNALSATLSDHISSSSSSSSFGLETVLSDAMTAWIQRCQDHPFIGVSLLGNPAQLIFTIAYSAGYDELATTFCQKALYAMKIAQEKRHKQTQLPSQHQHQPMIDDLLSEDESVLSLLRILTLSANNTHHLRLREQQHNMSSPSSSSSTLAAQQQTSIIPSSVSTTQIVYSKSLFALLQAHFHQTLHILPPMLQQYNDVTNKGEQQQCIMDFFINYWLLEHTLQNASIVLPEIIYEYMNSDQILHANLVIEELYSKLYEFASDTSLLITEMTVDNAYERNVLRILCDSIGFQYKIVFHSHTQTHSQIPQIPQKKQHKKHHHNSLSNNKQILQHDGKPINLYQHSSQFVIKKTDSEEYTMAFPPQICIIPSLQDILYKQQHTTAVAQQPQSHQQIIAKPLYWKEASQYLLSMPEEMCYEVINKILSTYSKEAEEAETETVCSINMSWIFLLVDILHQRQLPLPTQFFTHAMNMMMCSNKNNNPDFYSLVELAYIHEFERLRAGNNKSSNFNTIISDNNSYNSYDNLLYQEAYQQKLYQLQQKREASDQHTTMKLTPEQIEQQEAKAQMFGIMIGSLIPSPMYQPSILSPSSSLTLATTVDIGDELSHDQWNTLFNEIIRMTNYGSNDNSIQSYQNAVMEMVWIMRNKNNAVEFNLTSCYSLCAYLVNRNHPPYSTSTFANKKAIELLRKALFQIIQNNKSTLGYEDCICMTSLLLQYCNLNKKDGRRMSMILHFIQLTTPYFSSQNYLSFSSEQIYKMKEIFKKRMITNDTDPDQFETLWSSSTHLPENRKKLFDWVSDFIKQHYLYHKNAIDIYANILISKSQNKYDNDNNDEEDYEESATAVFFDEEQGVEGIDVEKLILTRNLQKESLVMMGIYVSYLIASEDHEYKTALKLLEELLKIVESGYRL